MWWTGLQPSDWLFVCQHKLGLGPGLDLGLETTLVRPYHSTGVRMTYMIRHLYKCMQSMLIRSIWFSSHFEWGFRVRLTTFFIHKFSLEGRNFTAQGEGLSLRFKNIAKLRRAEADVGYNGVVCHFSLQLPNKEFHSGRKSWRFFCEDRFSKRWRPMWQLLVPVLSHSQIYLFFNFNHLIDRDKQRYL